MQRIDIGVHKALIRLSDQNGGESTYVIKIKVKKENKVSSISNFNATTILDETIGDYEPEILIFGKADKSFVPDPKEGEISLYKGSFYSNGTC